MSSSGWALAIDFGTSFTTAAMAADGTPPVVVEVEHSRYLPSTVVADNDGQLLTGQAALRRAMVFPERAVRVPKRALVAGPQVVLGGRAVPVADLVAAVLARVYGEAVRFRGGQPPAKVVLTHPARWGTVPLDRLRDAAAAAGITEPVLLPEPVAAAWWFGGPSADGGLVGVFDLGGGTLDTAVLRGDPGGFAIAGPPGGDADLGGEDFDELLLGRVSELARDRDELAWADVFTGDDLRSRRDLALLRGDVTAAKETLSELLTYEVVVPGFAEGFRVTRPELDELFGPAVDSAVAEMRATIAAAGADPATLGGLYLTGGSSRMPIIASRLAAELGVLPQIRDDPKAAVALGALTALKAVPAAPTAAVAAAAVTAPAVADAAAGTGVPVTGTAVEALARADALLAAFDYTDTEAAYREAIKLDPASAAAQSGLAVALARVGRADEAEAAAREAIRLDPNLALAHARLGGVLARRAKYAEAESACREAVRLDPVQDSARIDLASALTGLKKYAAALSILQDYVNSPDAQTALRATGALGRLRLAQKNYPGARAAFEKVIDSGHPEFAPAAMHNLGVVLRAEKNFTAARLAFERALESRHPRVARTAFISLSSMLEDRKEYAAARTLYQSVIDSGNHDLAPTAHGLLGDLLSMDGTDWFNAAAAQTAYQQAIDSGDPQIAPAAAYGGGRRLQRLKPEVAREMLEYAINSGHPVHAPNAAYELGAMLRGEGDFVGAQAAYEKAIELDGAHAFQAGFELGNMLAAQENSAQAAVAYEQAVKAKNAGKDLEGMYRAGLKLADLGRIDAARSAFQRVVDAGTGKPYATVAKLAISHLSTLQSDLKGRKGKITISRKWTMAGWGGWPVIDIDWIYKGIPIKDGVITTREVAAGPHLIKTSDSKIFLAVHVAPGKEVKIQYSEGWASKNLSVLG